VNEAAAKLAQVLASRRSGGGYEAVAGGGASTESTALAALALDDAEARRWLVARQRADGAWPLGDAVPEPSWASSWALIALAGSEADAATLARGADWLVAREAWRPSLMVRAIRVLRGQSRDIEHDLTLRGWPWHAAAAAWCEPTACAVLALRRLGPHVDPPRARERALEGQRLLWNRMCVGGGWNYGNRRVLGESIPPYPDTTALVLIALQGSDRSRDLGLGFAALDRLLDAHASSLSLALAVLARELHGRDARPLRLALAERVARRAPPLETRTAALALLALEGGAERLRA
jgi:hypothetical protein